MAYRKTEFVENKRRETRERIVKAGRQLVEEGGWKNCTLTRTAKAAGVASGSVYNHFSKITDLYIELFLRISEEEVGVLSQVASMEATAGERFYAVLDTFARRALKGRAKAYAVIAEPVAPEVDEVRQQTHEDFISLYQTIISEGIEEGVFRKQNSQVAATCVMGALVEALVVPLASRDISPMSDDQLRGDVLSFCMTAVGADPSTGNP